MKAIVNLKSIDTIEQLAAFLAGSQRVAFCVPGDRGERYRMVEQTLLQFRYQQLDKKSKGVVIRFLMQITGYSRQQLTRHIQRYKRTGQVTCRSSAGNGFQRRYDDRDIRLIAEADERYDCPSGAVLRKYFERGYEQFGQQEYERLRQISVAHLYNLRKSKAYLRRTRTFTKTRPRVAAIGERRKPVTGGKPGFVRVDTVHQGDRYSEKGVYHINCVDEVTQYEAILSTEKISEAYLVPVLEQILDSFPFKILGFHSDNGSEYINYKVAKLLNKLNAKFTKSRPRHSNDNGLVESKNASIVRRHLGYAYIAQKQAERLNEFHVQHLIPFINYHRPCYFPSKEMTPKGKIKKRYRLEDMMTPYEKLKTIANAASFLKPGLTFERLDELAYAVSDDEAADQLNKAKERLFNDINEQDAIHAR